MLKITKIIETVRGPHPQRSKASNTSRPARGPNGHPPLPRGSRDREDAIRKRLRNARPTMTDGPVAVEGVFVRFRRTDSGAMGAVFRNPVSGTHVLFAVSFKDGRIIPLARQ